MKKYILFIALILGSFLGRAQNLKQTKALADSLFQIAEYEQAEFFYQRVLFFSLQKGAIYLRLADSYLYSRKYVKAYFYYQLAYNTLHNNSLKLDIVFKKALCDLMTKKYALGLQALLDLPDTLGRSENYRRNFYLGSFYFGLKKFSQAQVCFLASLPDTAYKLRERIKKILSSKSLERPNPKLAHILSLFLPGSGQLLAQNYKQAANSFLLTGSLSLLTIYVAKAYSPADAFLAIFPWLYRYYLGGASHAKKIATYRQAEHLNDSYNQILEIYEQTQK